MSDVQMRILDSQISRESLDSVIADYSAHYSNLPDYDLQLRGWIARYSRGDSRDELLDAYRVVAEKAVASGEQARAKYGPKLNLFTSAPGSVALFRDALVMLSIGLSLRAPANQLAGVLKYCDRGDPILETLVRVSGADSTVPPAGAAFPLIFDGLYAALAAPSPERPVIIARYLDVWLEPRMREFGFKIFLKKVGYWCFEAAGLVAALDIDDRSFASHPNYPAELVAFYRAAR
jgi:hypothetical protein